MQQILQYGVNNGTTKVKSLQKRFLPERVVMIWNKLPLEVKSSSSVKDFKINLECFKKANIANVGSENDAYFWKVSSTVISKIENSHYLENKVKHNEFLSNNPYAAKKLFINMKGYVQVEGTLNT